MVEVVEVVAVVVVDVDEVVGGGGGVGFVEQNEMYKQKQNIIFTCIIKKTFILQFFEFRKRNETGQLQGMQFVK
jgi:hypothetical protein